tara:strand:- start:2392 stop:2844 length:453 start_codon:yes stop_codon:yes gene_type:complete
MGSVVVKEACTSVENNQVTVTVCVEPQLTDEEAAGKVSYVFNGTANWARAYVSDVPSDEVGGYVKCLKQVKVDASIERAHWVLEGTYVYEHKKSRKRAAPKKVETPAPKPEEEVKVLKKDTPVSSAKKAAVSAASKRRKARSASNKGKKE